MLTEYLPFTSDQSVRSRLNELEKEAGSLPIVFGVLTGKVIEKAIMVEPIALLKFVGAAVATGGLYVYRKHIQKVAEDVKDEVSDGGE